MRLVSRFAGVGLFLSFSAGGFAQTAAKPEDALAAAFRAFFDKAFVTDWQGVEKIPGIRWAALPPQSLQNCLPDGSCFVRQGVAAIGGRQFVIVAGGARTIVSTIYFRNGGAPVGEAAVMPALKAMNLTAELARCPAPGTAGGTNWYKVTSPATNPGVLSVQSSCAGGRACEGFVLTLGADLPALQPNQLRLYSESCTAGGARAPVSTKLPHEQLGEALAGLIPPVAGPALYDWKALTALLPGAQWSGDPKNGSLSGAVAYGGRKFSLQFTGSPAEVKVAEFDEQGLHPRGENLLAVVYNQGYQVRLVRCGPIYTESTNNWYSLTGPKGHPVLIRQSIRYEGNQVQDTYELRLDNTLPARDPRDRDPGVNGCR